MTGTYAEQFARMKRYLARLTDLKNGVAHLRSTDYYTDDLYAFFQSCHHLKDWIKHDPVCAGWTDPEAHINGSADLQIAADLCNATKHLKLTSSVSVR